VVIYRYILTEDESKKISRRKFMKGIAVAGAAAAVVGATGTTMMPNVWGPPAKLDTPTITCLNSTQHTIFLQICAGNTGAAAGFTVQWVKHSDYPDLVCNASSASGWPGSSPNFCEASFGGVPGCSRFNLGPNECVTVEIGNVLDSECGVSTTNCGGSELECGTEYVFRVFAHNIPGPGGLNASDKSNNKCCSTEPCVEGCVLTQGYWKQHPCEWPSPFVPGANGTALSTQCALTKNPNEQCACDATNTIPIGSNAYNQCQLLCVLDQPGEGNALIILAHQLIAAKLNVLSGAAPPSGNAIGVADGLIGSSDILSGFVDPSSTLGQQMTDLADALDLYNNGDGGVTHCP
jgi:hypothetical protein